MTHLSFLLIALLFHGVIHYGGAFAQTVEVDLVPPGYQWEVIETEHFKVLFWTGHSVQAQKAAYLAEKVHHHLLPFLKSKPDGRTNIILTDHLDQANALSTAFPKKTIVLYLRQPSDSPGNYSDWMEEAIVHEYAHILALDMTSGLPEWLSSAFGRIFLPNAVQPMFQLEGLAVYAESRYTDFGRNNGALYHGILRSFVYDRTWPSIDLACVFRPEWPYDAPYLFGGMFNQYLSDSFGESKLAEYQIRHGGLVLPFMQNRTAKQTYGKSLPVLWRKWYNNVVQKYTAEIERLRLARLSNLENVTSDGNQKNGLAVSPDRRYCAFVRRNGRDLPRLILYDFATRNSRVLARGCFVGTPAFSPDGGSLVHARTEYLGTGEKYFSDLYQTVISSGEERRLSIGLRASDPAFSSDGRYLYVAVQEQGRGALCRIDMTTLGKEYLVPFSDSCTYSHLSISPDGGNLAASCWTEGGYWDIYIYDLQLQEFKPLIIDRWQDLWPRWSCDGQRIIFSSDRSGVWNIWEYDLKTESMVQKTNVIGGAFEPAFLGNDSLLFLNLSSNGYDLAKTYGDGQYQGPASEFMKFGFEDTVVCKPTYLSKRYLPLKSMLPVLWLPTATADEESAYLGAVLWGWDDLMRKNYVLSTIPAIGNGRLYYDLNYADNSRRLNWKLFLSDIPHSYAFNFEGQDTVFWQREQDQTIEFSLPFKRTSYQMRPFIQYRHKKVSPLNFTQMIRPFWSGDLGNITGGVRYNDAKEFPCSISPEKGRTILAEAVLFRDSWGSDIDQSSLLMQWSEYISMPPAHQVLMIRTGAGIYQYGDIGIFEKSELFDLRGQSQQVVWGRRKAVITVEYRLPLVNIKRGVSTWPVFFDNVNGSLFCETGTGELDFKDIWEKQHIWSMGLELKADWQVFYALPLRITLGLVKNSAKAGKTSWYVTMGQR